MFWRQRHDLTSQTKTDGIVEFGPTRVFFDTRTVGTIQPKSYAAEAVYPGTSLDKCEDATYGQTRKTVTCYLPRSDPQCHGAKMEKEADQGRGMKRRDADQSILQWKN